MTRPKPGGALRFFTLSAPYLQPVWLQVFEVILSRMTNDLDEIEYALSDVWTHSFLALHISGLVAKVLARHPGLTPFQVKTILHATARNVSRGAGTAT